MSDSFVAEPLSTGWQPFQVGPWGIAAEESASLEFPSIGPGVYDYTFILTDVDIECSNPGFTGNVNVVHQPYGLAFFHDETISPTNFGVYYSWRGAHIFQPGDFIEVINNADGEFSFTGFGWVNLGGFVHILP